MPSCNSEYSTSRSRYSPLRDAVQKSAKLGYFYQPRYEIMKVVITGISKGIGRAIAELLYENGADIFGCSRGQEALTELEKDLKSSSGAGSIHLETCDMSQKDAVLAFADSILSTWGTVDVLVNNAGVFFPGQLATEEDGKLETMINTNLYSAYYLTRALLPAMTEQGSGHIFNMCSVASLFAYPNGGSYSISKFALLGFSKVLREELKSTGIKVTSILPGATWSNSWAGVDLPESRLMQAKDIAISVWQAMQMSPSAVVEEILIRPQLGDL